MEKLIVASSSDGNRTAIFSLDRRYRYSLSISWDENKPRCCFIMLNPSTADEMANDPTVERCERRSRSYGFGSLTVLNIFAYRSTNPRALYEVDDPVGPLNDHIIRMTLNSASFVVCGWGQHGKFMNRGSIVIRSIKELGIVPHALGLTREGHPVHPLYISYSITPAPIA